MYTKLIIILSFGFVVLFTGCASMFFGCASTVDPGNRGVIWRPLGSGLAQEEIHKDGIVWHWPWNDVIEYDVQWNSYQEQVAILTSDDLHMNVTISVILRPILDELYYLALNVGPDYYSRLVKPELFTITRNVTAKYVYTQLPEKSPLIEKEILGLMKEHLKDKHIEIDNITLDHIMYSQLVTEASDQKLATKQKLEQKDFETGIAVKDADIQRIRAKGQRDSQKIIDEGLTQRYLQYKSLEVQDKLSTSPNSKFYFIPLGKDGLPVILGSDSK